MKKIITLFTLLAIVALPASVMGAKTGDFELGGYIKLLGYWETTNAVNKNISNMSSRNNAPYPSHDGHTRFTAQETRFNFKIKGPEVWGAKTEGYIEVDFDPNQDGRQSASQAYAPRMRHAWFRMSWPGGWQVLMGQYWGVFCNFFPETVNGGPLQFHGMATQRVPQVRVSYKTGPWSFHGFVGTAYDPAGENAAAAFLTLPGTFPAGAAAGVSGNLLGQRGIMPQFGAQVEFEKDLYGKAAFYSRPRGFTANVSFGIQRTKYDGGLITANTWGQNGFTPAFIAGVQENEAKTPWAVQATLFIPVLVTKTEDLKNTASVTVQAYVGQGNSFFGEGLDADNSYWVFNGWDNNWNNNNLITPTYKRRLSSRYGGYIQGQYYFNNEWFVNYVYGFSKAFGVPRGTDAGLATNFPVANPNGYTYLSQFDQSKMIQEHNASLWYRPNKNFAFGLGYSYLNQNWFQQVRVGSNTTGRGDNHRVQFAGIFYF